MARLEKIVREMDSPTVPLDQLIKHYEAGIALVKVCELKLKDAEQKIEIIRQKASGEIVTEPFAPEDTKPGAKAPAGPRKDVSLF